MRRGTGLPARPDTWDAADKIRRDVENEVCGEIVYGIKPSRPVAIAARDYLELNPDGTPKPGGRGDRLGPKDLSIIQEVVQQFGFRMVNEISAVEWRNWLDARHAGNRPESRARHVNAIRPFLKWCAAEERRYIATVPALIDPDAPRQRQSRLAPAKRRRVADLRPDLLAFVFQYAHISLRAQLYTEWSTGARVSSVLFGCTLEDLVLTENRCQITFHDTKNGDDVVAVLHPAAVEVLREYLQWRGNLHQRKAPLFLTYKRKPYSARGRERGWSGFNKTAFNAMKMRAIRSLLRASVRCRRAGDHAQADQLRADARLVRQFTQHWLRHWFATHAMAMAIPIKLVMTQAGWRDERSVSRYEQDVEDVRRALVSSMPIGGTSLTRDKIGLPYVADRKQ